MEREIDKETDKIEKGNAELEKTRRRKFTLTCFILIATNLKPLASNRLIISPTNPRWTPSGLTMMKVRSLFPDILIVIQVKNENKTVNINYNN